MASTNQISRSETNSPLHNSESQSTHVFENLAKKLYRLESKLGKLYSV